jgi:hypothetical protein
MRDDGARKPSATVNKVEIIGKLKVRVTVSDDAASALAVTLVCRKKQNGYAF